MTTTKTRTLIGEFGTPAFNGYAGFRIGRQYLTYQRRDDGIVAIVLDHCPHMSPGVGPLVVSSEQFEKWFRK